MDSEFSTTPLLGAIAGDCIGSAYETKKTNVKTKNFTLFSEHSRVTDDTVFTLAVADAITQNGDYALAYRKWARDFTEIGGSRTFMKWCHADTLQPPYNSFSNGAAMRVGAIGFAFDTLETVLGEAKKSAECTHNHPEGIKGAQATAMAIFLARHNTSKDEIKSQIEKLFGYDLCRKLDDIRAVYKYSVECAKTVPEVIIAFLESTDYEDAIRNAVSIGGDSNTIAAISGGIAFILQDHAGDNCQQCPQAHGRENAGGYGGIWENTAQMKELEKAK